MSPFLWLGLIFPICVWLSVQLYSNRLRASNLSKRRAILSGLGITDAEQARKRILGLFHPYCNAGGGGERVLWTAIACIHRSEPDVVCAVYTGDSDASKDEIINEAKVRPPRSPFPVWERPPIPHTPALLQARFNIMLDPTRLHFVFMKSRYLVEDSTWPYFTLLGQSIGSMYLAWQAMSSLIPDLYIDTMGYAFTFRVVSLLCRIPVGAYVHYPTISLDMLARVRSRKRWHTNASLISRSPVLTWAKLLYYRIFMYYYSLSLQYAFFLMVNSSWTKNHVDKILQHSDVTLDMVHYMPSAVAMGLLFRPLRNHNRAAQIVYPPCDTHDLVAFSLHARERVILSVAQFRPEKDHATQLLALKQLFDAHPEYCSGGQDDVKLILIGGSRNDGDAGRVKALQRMSEELGIQDHVLFLVNAPYKDVLHWLSRASIGISTMVDEHFGINIVEFMAAGVIPVTHASGGPLKDIVVPFHGEPTGYHADSPQKFSEALHAVLTLSQKDELTMRQRARASAVQRFSEAEFERGWNASGWRTLLFGS